MLRSISSSEMVEWMAFYRLDPWGEWRDDLRAGVGSSIAANLHRKKGVKLSRAEDFILFDPGKKKQEKKTGAQPGSEELRAQLIRLKGRRV